MTLNERIGDFGGLVGLVLALLTLLTANRAASLAELRKAARIDSPAALREMWFDALLAVVTCLLLLAGLPLWIDAVRDLHPLRAEGPLRSVFVLTWVLLLPLIGWQVMLARSARDLKVKFDAQAGGPRGP